MIKYRGPGDLKVSFLLHEYLWYYIKKIVLWVVWTEGEWYAHFQIQDSLHCTMNAPHYFISATPRLPKVSPVVTIPDICQTPQKHLRAFFLQIPMHLVSGTTLPDFPLTLQFSFSFPSNFSSYTHFLYIGGSQKIGSWTFSLYSLLKWFCLSPWFFYPSYTSDSQEIIVSPQLSSHRCIHISGCSFNISSTLFIRQVNPVCPTPSSWFSIQPKQLYPPPRVSYLNN